MREIKFRAWDAYNKRMLTGDQLEETENIVYSMDYGELTIAWIDPNGDYNDVIPMQFTGRLDKNGKEIYEGDWCRACFRDKNGYHYVQGNVFMDDYMWCLESRGDVMKGDIFSINRLHDWEVLDNIYDNPALLT